MAKLVASTITVKDLISSEADDEHDEQQEKSPKGDIDPYVSMKLRGMCFRREIYRLCVMTSCGKYLNARRKALVSWEYRGSFDVFSCVQALV